MSLLTPRRIALAVVAATLVPAATALAGGSTTVTLDEFSVKASPKSITHGKVTFTVKNAGDAMHEMVIIKTSTPAAKLKVSHGRASEKGELKQEAEDIPGGKSKKLTVNLKKGHYALICNLPGHYQQGMHTDFTVK